MTFEDIVDQALAMLQRRGRVAYRTLKRQFQLEDEALEDLKTELIRAQRVAVDEDGEVLVWTGGASTSSASIPSPPLPREAPHGDQPSGRGTAPAQPRLSDAERRQLTVLFCDLVDSTVLASQLDPEDWREVVRAYQEACAGVIQQFDGHIAQYLGDGLLVYFGYPQAHEDDARGAVRTGLRLVEATGRLNARLQPEQGVQLAVRVGIHTGLVVVGEMGAGDRREQLALGDTPNLAARLQGLAEPNTVVISPVTYRLIQGYFACQTLGGQPLKGMAQPVEAYRVLHESGAKTRLEAALATGLTPLVGREEELEFLRARWEQVKAGRGQVVLLSGEAGIGKSRLVHLVKDQVAHEPSAGVMACQCVAYAQNSPLYPLIDWLEREELELMRDDSPQQKLAKLEAWLARSGFPLPETVPLFATLLSIPLGEGSTPLPLTPAQHKHKTLQAILTALQWCAAQHPLLLVMEDLHWADASTLELLTLLVDRMPMARTLLLLTCRPEFTPPWGVRSHLAQVTLTRLPQQQTATMIARLTQGKALPAEVLRQLVLKTDGVPLFVEELTKMVLESGWLSAREERYELTGPLPPLVIPTTLHDSLMARVDRLTTVKEVLQLGATLGQEFPYDVLWAVSSLDEGTLQRELHRLVEAELLYQSGFPPQARYRFKHALIQDIAYQQMLRSKRQQSHQRIAQVLEGQFAEATEAQPELLAYHYTEAGLLEHAIPYWQRASRRAMERSANVEAVGHLTKGIALLKQLEDTPARLQQELECQTALGTALMATRGYAAPEVAQTYSRARELCQQVGDVPQLFSALWGVWYFYAVRPDVRKAAEVAQQLFALAQRAHDATHLMVAHRVLGATLIVQGALAQGLAQLRQGMSLYEPQQHRALALVYGQDIGVVCQQWSAWALWLLGYPDQAWQLMREALQMAQEVSHPLTLAYVMTHGAYFHLFRRDTARARALAESALRLAMEQGFGLFIASAKIMLGEVAEPGAIAAGIARMREGIAAWRATGAELFLPFHLTQLAAAYGNVGQADVGLTVVAEALALVERGGEHIWDADLYRVRGELMLMSGADASAAEACFHDALAVARRQGAKVYELRAAVSLSRLLKTQGQTEKARMLLLKTYSWFTEGFDTADLQEAKVLLSALAES
jgi:TOMM system kinase/cyclase fusion protein